MTQLFKKWKIILICYFFKKYGEILILKNYGFKNEQNDICLTFDMSKLNVHDFLGKEPNYIMSTLEYYDDFRIDYNNDNKVIAFEFFSSANVVIKSENFLT